MGKNRIDFSGKIKIRRKKIGFESMLIFARINFAGIPICDVTSTLLKRCFTIYKL